MLVVYKVNIWANDVTKLIGETAVDNEQQANSTAMDYNYCNSFPMFYLHLRMTSITNGPFYSQFWSWQSGTETDLDTSGLNPIKNLYAYFLR